MGAAVRRPGSIDERLRILAALRHVPAEDRDRWLRIGMAIKSALGEEGFALWDEWSRSSERYREADARSAWRSIRAHGEVTLGTLFYEAEKHGYVPITPRWLKGRPEGSFPAESRRRGRPGSS